MLKPSLSPIRAVIADDSAGMRELLAAILRSAGDIQVVGIAADGREAVQLVQNLHPNVVTMDLHMPRMNGLEAVRTIMREAPTPIVLISATHKVQDMELTFKALRAGALTVINKPGLNDPENSQLLIQTVRLMAGVPVIHHWGRSSQPLPAEMPPTGRPPRSNPAAIDIPALKSRIRIVGIAASTGGPSAIARVLKHLPADYPLPIVLVQHFSPGFAGGLAEWLGTQTRLRVEIAAHGDTLQPGVAFLAPDDYHLHVNARGGIDLSKDAAYKGLRPSANPFFESLAKSYGRAALGIVLTGMGDDGAQGLLSLRNAGGITFAQDAESCVVYGMPREALECGGVDEVLSPEQIASILERLGAAIHPDGGKAL